MPRLVSLGFRRHASEPASDDMAIVLITITHPDLATPVRLSSDPTELISEEPLAFATRSRGQLYDYVLASAVLPGDSETGVTPATIAIANIDRRIGEIVRSFSTPATVKFEIVLLGSPDLVEMTWTGLETLKSETNADIVTIDGSRRNFSDEPWPAGRMTQSRFSGVRR